MKTRPVALGIVAVTLFTFPASADGDDSSTVLVQLDEPGASLHRVGASRWAPPICTAPCEVHVPRDGTYYVIDRNKKSRPFTFTTSSGERVHVDVHLESVSRAPVGGAILGGTLLLVGAFELAAAPLRGQDSCSGFFCIPPSAFASLFDAFAVVLGTAGTITSLAFFAATKTRVVVDTDGHGAFLGVRGAF